jgi:hypothetical protein
MTVFSIGMTPAEAERHAHIAITKFKRLSVYNPSDPIVIQHMLVNKLPAALANKKKRLEELLYTSKASSSAAPSYSDTAIIGVIGIYLNTASAYAQPSAAESGNCFAGHEYEARNQTCHACGKNGHISMNCLTIC